MPDTIKIEYDEKTFEVLQLSGTKQDDIYARAMAALNPGVKRSTMDEKQRLIEVSQECLRLSGIPTNDYPPTPSGRYLLGFKILLAYIKGPDKKKESAPG